MVMNASWTPWVLVTHKHNQKVQLESKQPHQLINEREDAQRQFELDERVMLIDTSGMTDVQKQFYQAKQNEILARRLE